MAPTGTATATIEKQDAPLQASATKTPESYSLPSAQALKAAGEVQITDEHGKSFPFKDLYEGSREGERQLVVFVRHFFCGSCEEYIRSLTPTLPPSVLEAIPGKPTKLIFIGCGGPELIPRYRERTMSLLREKGEEEYALYANPGQEVYKALGMVVTLTNPATAPGYITTGYWSKVAEALVGMLSTVPQGIAHKGGPPGQNGGEFLFEGGELVWSHRMQSTQDHCEAEELRGVLGVEG